MMTLKEILDAVLMETGFDEQSSYAGSTDPDYRQLTALANRSNRVLSRFDWTMLRSEYWFTLDGAEEYYALPADFRAYVPDTAFKDQSFAYVLLPTNHRYWAYLQSNNTTSGVQLKMRFNQNQIQVHDPGANSGQPVRIEYISDWAVESVNSPDPVTGNPVYQSRFLHDDDKWRLDDDLIIMDLVWRWRRKQGIEQWQADKMEFLSYQNRVRGDDGGSRTLYMGEPVQWLQWPPHSPQADLWVGGGGA